MRKKDEEEGEGRRKGWVGAGVGTRIVEKEQKEEGEKEGQRSLNKE